MKSNLLIIDDDQDLLRSLSRALGDRFSVLTAPGADEAISAFSNQHVDFVLVDYRLGLKNGHDLIEEMRRIRPAQSRFLLMTAYADKDMAIRSVNLRLDGFLEKPFTSAIVEQMIEKLLKSAQIPDELQVDPVHRLVHYRGRSAVLTKTELSMLNLFREKPGIFFTRQQIESMIWPNVQVAKNNLDTHLSRLRAKIPILKKRLICVRGEGFIYRPHERVDD